MEEDKVEDSDERNGGLEPFNLIMNVVLDGFSFKVYTMCWEFLIIPNKTEQNRTILCFNTAEIKIVCKIQCFSNAVSSIAECGVSATLKLVFRQHSVLTLRNYFLIMVFQQHTKKNLYSSTINQLLQKCLPHIEGFSQEIMLKSIFLLIEGLHQERFSSTNQFFTISENYNFSTTVLYKKNSLSFF